METQESTQRQHVVTGTYAGHTITWEHDTDMIRGTIHCPGEPPDGTPTFLLCRFECDQDGCEEGWSGEVWFDGKNLHHANEYSMNDGQNTHQLTPNSECNVKAWMEDEGTVQEDYDGPDTAVHSGEITVNWDGDNYLWSYADK